MSLANRWPVLCVLIFAAVLPAMAFACSPARISLAQRVAAAQDIYVGVVTDVVVDTNAGSKKIESMDISPSSQAYSVKVSVTEVLKGEHNQANIQPSIANCGSGSAGQNDKVIVFLSDGYWYTTKFAPEKYAELVTMMKEPKLNDSF